jgi:hypothetical protein
MTPIGFFCYGGLVAVQTLWAVPWMTRVAGYTPIEAATGLFWINISMLVCFWAWGMISPWLARRGLTAEKLIKSGLPLSFALLAIIITAKNSMFIGTAALLAMYCVSCTFVSLAQPAVGMAFPSHLAGRALSAYNLVIFSGIFVIQWGIGLLVDGFKAAGMTEVQAFQSAFGVYLMGCVAAYAYFVVAKSHNQSSLTP